MGSIPVVGALGAKARRGILAVAALALGSIPTFAAVNHASAAGACSVSYVVTNQWSTGFTVQGIQITNLGPAINGWTLTFSFPGNQTIAAGPWNGTFTQTGSQVTVTNLSYNGSVATNASVNPGPGFNGAYTGTNPPPTSFSLNGTVCNGGTPTPTPTTSGTPTPTPSGTPNPTPTPTATPTATPSGTPTPTPTPTNTGPHPANPYPGANLYLNPDYQKEVQAQATADNSTAEAKVAIWQTAIWMDHKGAITGDSTHMGLQAQLDNAVSKAVAGTPELVEVVIYDLPGRDCAALASNGEIPATAAGLTDYETNYITPIANIFANPKYANLRIVTVIEPDSLPNAVTNTSKPTCSTAAPFYEQGIEFALNSMSAIPNVWRFLDIAHSAWLGWPNNTQLAGPEFAKVVKATTRQFGSLDGFISDTANYTPTIEPFLPTTNPTQQIGGQAVNSVLFYQFNVTFDENTYDLNMYNELVSQGFPATIGFLIDTSRNGWGGPARPTAQNNTPTTAAAFVAANKIDQRGFRGNWCNQNGAGIGTIPQANPSGVNSHIFAFVWVKPPGESDGDYPTATHSHGDPHCDPNGTNTDGSGNTYPVGSIPGFDIPAGQFFPAQFQQLVANSFPKIQ